MENTTVPTSVHRILLDGRELILLGTAHISKESIELVEQTIRAEHPDRVCVELDEGRLKALTEPDRWKTLDLKAVIRQGQLSTLITNLMLASYQKRMGGQTGVKPGEELLAAVQTSKEMGIPVDLADRDVKTTLRRAWRLTPFYRKLMLMGTLFESLFDTSTVSEEQLRELKQQDTLGAMMNEFGKTFPELKQVVISERDHYLAGRILAAQGNRVLAVVGAGHVQGIVELIESKTQPKSEAELTFIPPPNPLWKALLWLIPILFVASMVYLGYSKGLSAVGHNLLYWVLITGIPAAVGTAIALPHPLVVLVAFVMAPLKPLHPFVGTGVFTAFTQAWLVPPRVHEMETVAEDIAHVRQWWKNRLLRIFLCFILPMFALVGDFLGGKHILHSIMH